MGIQILSAASYTPPKILSNEELAKKLNTSDEWIYSHTGIKNRHISEDKTSADLGTEAAKIALSNAGVDAQDVDFIVVATSTPPYINFPSTACVIQKKLHIKNCCAYDISAACSGFVYAFMNIIHTLEYNRDKPQYALIIGAEVFSKILDWTDRSTCILFGDGAGAILVFNSPTTNKDEDCKIINSYLESDTTNLNCLFAGLDDRFYNNLSSPPSIFMNGRKIYNFAVKIIPHVITTLLKNIDLNLDDIDLIISHQANTRIIQSAAKKLKIPMEKFFINIENYANTSAASIPIALSEIQEKNILQKNQHIILVGFGAGLTYGGILIKW